MNKSGRLRDSRRPRVAFVIQRYGEQVTGGAEALCRQVAVKMSQHWDIEVLSTSALDYTTWKNHYPPGSDELDGIRLKRFTNVQERLRKRFRIYSGLLKVLPHWIPFRHVLERRWVLAQGPVSPSLLEYIRANNQQYDFFIFFTYLYYPTLFGLPIVSDKAILVSHAHDEPAIHMGIYRDLFSSPSGIIFMTPEERAFVHETFENDQIPNRVLSIGVDMANGKAPPLAVGDKEIIDAIEAPYMFYLGRIDPGKSCDLMFEYFIRYYNSNGRLKLVVAGPKKMAIPDHPGIIYLGYISETLKFHLMEKMDFLVAPSVHESLSLVLLEAWAHSQPVLVNRRTPVLRGQVSRCGGGLMFDGYEDFEKACSRFVDDPDFAREAGSLGRSYVENNYDWEKVVEEYQDFVRRFLLISSAID